MGGLGEKRNNKPRYSLVLLDADNTIFDFDAAEIYALRSTIEVYGGTWSGGALVDYQRINRPLWDAFHRGEVTQECLTVERFRKCGK